MSGAIESGYRAPTPAETRAAFDKEIARFDQEYSSEEETLDVFVKTLRRSVEQLKRESVGESLTAAKGRAVSFDFVKKAKELGAAIASAVQARNALAKTAKQRAETYTPEERRRAFLLAVAKMPSGERRQFIREAAEAHEAAVRKAVAAGLETAEETDFVRLI